MRRFLFIKPKHIGDSLILTPTLVAVKRKHPDAKIWVVLRRGCEGILAGCPEIDRILLLAPVEKKERTLLDLCRGLGIALLLAVTRFEAVFELGDGARGRFFARLARTRRRYSVRPTAPLRSREAASFTAISTFDWSTCHRVEKDYRTVAGFLDLPGEIPSLRFDSDRMQDWPPAAGLRDFALVQVGTRQGFNRWPAERWQELCAGLLQRFPAIIVAGGSAPEEVELAEGLEVAFGSRLLLATRGSADWSQLAGLLRRARLYVGPNTAAMHLAAACGCPCVALFGPSIEDFWHPWQVPYRIVTPPGHVPSADVAERFAAIKLRRMEDIPSSAVLAAVDELVAATPARTLF